MANIVQNPREFLIYPRHLGIAWSEDSRYWSWLPLPYETPSETLVEVAVLEAVCWLDVNGKFNTSELTPETMYEVVFVVKLEETTAFGWETPVNLKLDLPNGASPQERSVSLEEYIGNGWVDISAGEFMTSPENIGEISFSMYETASNWWKKGLVVKRVAIRPKI